jgi:general stress protein 26
MSIRLTPDEAWAVLERAHTGILTTLRASGAPVSHPLWFAALDRTICFGTPARTKKVARITHDPRASFLVESGMRWAELTGVHLSGRIEPVEDEAEIGRITAALDVKYAAYRTEPDAMAAATRGYYAAGRRFFRLVPDARILSWDNSRIAVGQAP